jgi:5-methylcytosine-specific restriction endonuclease McrA
MLPGCQGIDYSAPARHPRSFTVDHILPRDLYPHLAEDPRNLQPACWHCNASKGTGPGRPALPDLGEPSEAF